MLFLNKLSIQSKLILFLMLVALLAGLPVALVGYNSGKHSLEQRVLAELDGQRNIRRTQCLLMLEHTRKQVVTLSAAPGCMDAMVGFRDSFGELKQRIDSDLKLSADEERTLVDFYKSDFLPKLAKQSEAPPIPESIVPVDPVTRYLQYQYIAKFPELAYDEEKLQTHQSGDGTGYDAVHGRYHGNLAAFSTSFNFEDLMLVDIEGNLVYSVAKTVEFGTNLMTGPYADSHLGELFREARRLRERDAYRFADFERYIPTLNQPAAFVASPIHVDNHMVGILILQFPVDQLVTTLTGNFQWEQEGLGSTGEVYLVGKDMTFRTRSRFIYEAFQKSRELGSEQPINDLLEELRSNGTPEAVIDRIRRQKSVLLALPVETQAVRQALSGHEGSGSYLDYRGQPVVGSYGPLDFEEIRWAIVAEMDEKEAFAPVRQFTRDVMLVSTAIALAIPVLGLLLSRQFLSPVRALTTAARNVAQGEIGAQAVVTSRDEFRELAEAFNEMSAGLKDKTRQLELKVRENEELLLNILPAPAAARLREGDSAASQNFGDVTVLIAEIVGLDEFSDGAGAEKGLALLHDLVVAFDEAAERSGVEKVKTSGASYLAVCGLSVQRPDHTSRVVDFAQELVRVLERINRDRGATLRLQVGINAGPVTGGVVGRNKFIYDLWGETVTVARGLRGRSEHASVVLLTRSVHDRVEQQYELGESLPVELAGRGTVDAWELATH